LKKFLSLKPPKGVSEVVRDHWIEVNFVLPQPITVVTTVDRVGRVNAALKSWVMYCSTRHIMFGCNIEHDTAKNVLETKEFVVNIPGEDILKHIVITALPYPRGVNEIEKAGLTAIPSSKVKPPRIKECKAHAECKLLWHKRLGGNLIVFIGRVIALSVDKDIVDDKKKHVKTLDLRQMLLVPDGIGVIERTKPLEVPEYSPKQVNFSLQKKTAHLIKRARDKTHL
jgi:flavin reductase (DIM6/NTAB) family NADH-FMN oxidoreductase RutF